MIQLKISQNILIAMLTIANIMYASQTGIPDLNTNEPEEQQSAPRPFMISTQHRGGDITLSNFISTTQNYHDSRLWRSEDAKNDILPITMLSILCASFYPFSDILFPTQQYMRLITLLPIAIGMAPTIWYLQHRRAAQDSLNNTAARLSDEAMNDLIENPDYYFRDARIRPDFIEMIQRQRIAHIAQKQLD